MTKIIGIWAISPANSLDSVQCVSKAFIATRVAQKRLFKATNKSVFYAHFLPISALFLAFLTRYLWVKPAGHDIAPIFGSQALCATLDQLGLMQEEEHFERTDRYAVLADTRCRERGLEGVMQRGVRPNPRKYPGVGECQFLVQSALGTLAILFIKNGNSNHYLWPTRRSNF